MNTTVAYSRPYASILTVIYPVMNLEQSGSMCDKNNRLGQEAVSTQLVLLYFQGPEIQSALDSIGDWI